MILTAPLATPSVRCMRNFIEEDTGVKLLYTGYPEKLRNKLHIRYGHYGVLPDGIEDTEYNSKKAVRFLSSKFQLTRFLRERGYNAPEFINDRLPYIEEYPVLIRQTLRGYKGQGIIPCRDEEIFLKNWSFNYWWCRYLPTSSEFRFHIGIRSDETLPIFRVMRKNPRTQEISDRDIHIRHSKEYRFSRRFRPYEKYPKMTEIVSNLSQDILEEFPGAKIYALDVGWSRELNAPIIFEANTAPGLDRGAARQYADYFIAEKIHLK